MEPITFLLWMWLTWGTVRMMTGARDSAPAAAQAAKPARSVKPAKGSAPAEAVTPPAGWAGRADAAARAARTTDWGNPGWWLRAALASAWTPLSDLRKGRRWAWDKYQERRRGQDTPDTPEVPEVPGVPETEKAPAGGDAQREQDPGPQQREERREETGDQRRRPDDHGDPGGRPGQERRRDDGRDEQPWWRRHQQGEDYEVDVEVVRPRPAADPAALGRPAPALTASAPTTPAWPEGPVTEPPHPPGPAIRTAPDATGIGQLEGTSEMSKYVAIPGMNAPATSIEVGGNTHDDAVQLSKKIVTAVKMSVDPATEAELMIRASLAAAWNAVDALAAAGISGPVIDKWANAVIAFDQAHKTAARLAAELNDAHDAAVSAERLQARLGGEIQAAVQAAGKSAANSTGYYGKS